MVTTTSRAPSSGGGGDGGADVLLAHGAHGTRGSHAAASPEAALDLIGLVRQLREQGRAATDEERALLASWMGWGPLAPAFERWPKDHWREVQAQFKLLLSQEEYSAASAATPTSFFTPTFLVRALWRIACDLGFTGGAVLEPGCGGGHILAHAPSSDVALTGVERDPFSAEVARLRIPEAQIVCAPLERTALRAGTFDLVIGNVPFSDTHIYDRDAPHSFSLHNYFLWKSLVALRPGGIAVLLTSRYTLDARQALDRLYLGRLGVLVGALRLPSGALRSARTEVITDILVLQRRYEGMTWDGHVWADTTQDVVESVEVNQYYASHPQHLLGEAFLTDHGHYREHEFGLKPPQEGIEAALERGIASLLEEARAHFVQVPEPPDRTRIPEVLLAQREDGRKEGSYHLIDGVLFSVVDGELVEVKRFVNELVALTRLRDAVLALLEAECDLDVADETLAPLRKRLNDCYDDYVAHYGPLHRAKIVYGKPDPETGEPTISRRRPQALVQFRNDPDYAVVVGLEHYDDETQRAEKAAIFTRRVYVRPTRKDRASSPAEALSLCLDECGHLDMAVIARLLGVSPEEAPALLGDLVFEDHTHPNVWITREEYLSGNVRQKLEEVRSIFAQFAHESEKVQAYYRARYDRNMKALLAVQPEDLAPEEIRATLGAPWIAPSDIEQFCQEMFGSRPTVSYEPRTGTWEVSIARFYSLQNAQAQAEWGTARVDAYRLTEIGLNKGVPVVHDTVNDVPVKNLEETLAAQDKLRAIAERFSAWVWEDPERATRLATEYNRRYNAIVPRQYDGSHLTFPEMEPEWIAKMYPWQASFIWRMICRPSALCGFPVGAGKTFIEIAGAMRLRQLGLISRAAIVVPNHLLEQVAAEASRMYPTARILILAREDLTKERRKLFAARIALGNYDLVVMTHSSFGALGVHPATEHAYLEERCALYREALYNIPEDGLSTQKRTIKRIESAIEKMRQRQRELLDRPRDDGLTFEQLGISYLVIDEAHLFKNLGLPTNVQGLQAPSSKRATDLEMKLRWLEKHNGQGKPFASFFTATPLSNNMVEAYVMAWYLAYSLLEEYGLYTVDAFASLFVELQTRVEVSPNGASFRLHTRPARFINMPEFLALFSFFADVRDPSMLDGKRPRREEHIVTIEPDTVTQEYVNSLVRRAEAILAGRPQSISGRDDNMLWVTTHGRMAALDLDLVLPPGRTSSPKLEAVAREMTALFRRAQTEMAHLPGRFKSLQIAFCDLGTPHEGNEQVYGKLKRLLIAGGIPAEGVRYIHEARTDRQKAALFAECRSGNVAILLGSTALLGTGTNVQQRCIAVHNIDAPWRPDEVEQREGRGHRPGNLCPVVHIFRYVQRRTFDAYSWQVLTTKARFFHQLRSGRMTVREMDEPGENELSYAQVKAAATGDELVLEQAELDVEITRLQRLHSAHARARCREAYEARTQRNEASFCRTQAEQLRAMAARMQERPASARGLFTRTGEPLADRQQIGAYLAEQIQRLLFYGGREYLGTWNGESLFIESTLETIVGQKRVKLLLIIGSNYEVRIDVSPSWLNEKQQWRFDASLSEACAQLLDQATWAERAAERHEAQALAFERSAETPFVHSERLARMVERKRLLDAYTERVAVAKEGNGSSSEEIAAMRRELLRTRLNWNEREDDAGAETATIAVEENAGATTVEEMVSKTKTNENSGGGSPSFLDMSLTLVKGGRRKRRASAAPMLSSEEQPSLWAW